MKLIEDEFRHWLHDREYYVLGIRVFGPYEAEKLKQQILGNQWKSKLYDEFFDAVNIEDAIDIIRKDKEIVERLKDKIQEMKSPTSDDEFFNEKKFSFADTKEIFIMLLQSILTKERKHES